MAEWIRVVIPSSEEFRFPNLCPGCLRPAPDSHLRIQSDRSRLKGFYLVAAKWEYLQTNVPFCGECAGRRTRWQRYDIALLLVATLGSLAFAGLITAWLRLAAWGFWVIFLGAAVISTKLCNRLLTDNRAVRIERQNDNTVTFSFSHGEYVREFERLNGQASPRETARA